MHWRYGAALLSFSLLIPATAQAYVPWQVKQMLDQAAKDGNSATLNSTAKLAKKTNPQWANDIDAYVAKLNAVAERHRRERLQRLGFFRGWSGQGQLGASYSTGNSKDTSLALGLALKKDGLRWKYALNATADYQRSNGASQKQRYFAGLQTDYKVTKRFYVLGLYSWERNRFAGFSSRMSESLGFGYSLIKIPDMTLSIEGGPAVRQTKYITGISENKIAGRAALDYQWTLSPSLIFSQKITYYGEKHDSTLTSDTALTTKLIGALSAQLSFHMQHESNPPLALKKTDTTSRVTLVYTF